MYGFPFKLEDNLITVSSDGKTKKHSSFDDASHNDSFLYIRPYADPELIGDNNIIYGPFLLGPQSVPLKNEFKLSYENSKNYREIAICWRPSTPRSKDFLEFAEFLKKNI